METLVPAFLVLHIFGMLLWFGAVLVLYLAFGDLTEEADAAVVRHAMEWIHRINRNFLNGGLILSILTGVLLIVVHGLDWFAPRHYVHAKILLALIAAGTTHVGMTRIRKARVLFQNEAAGDAERAARQAQMRSWKTLLATTAAIQAIIVILAIFKFGQ